MADRGVAGLVPGCRVILDGKRLDPAKDARLTKVLVDLDADLFGECALVFHDPQLELINGKDFEGGKHVKVEIGFAPRLVKVFEGEVTALEPRFRRDMPPSLKVICHESIHRLALSQKTRAFNNVDDKEVVTQIAREHGLQAAAPKGTKEHLLQASVTDAVLLKRIAHKQGLTVRIEGKKLVVGAPHKGEEVEIAPGAGLKKISVKIDSGSQVGAITVHGWDSKAKREIIGQARPEGETGEGARKHGGGASLALAGHESTPADTASADAMAKGRLRKLAEEFVVAQAELIGDPRIVPGAVLSLAKLGAQIDGRYRVEHAAHQFSKDGYLVRFRAVRIGKLKPPGQQVAKETTFPEREPPPPDAHVIVMLVKSIGGTPLVNHLVRILDEKGRRVGNPVTTDGEGVLRAEVPENKKYRVEILDEEMEHAVAPLHPGDEGAVLLCQFVELHGSPVANEKVEVKAGDDKFELTTDELGRIHSPAHLGACELTVRNESFIAHALPVAQTEREESIYRFVLGETGPGDVHVLVAEVKGIGDTLLVNHPVRILDPESGAEAAYAVTDAQGVIHVEVPENKTYRIEIVDEESDHAVDPLQTAEERAALICHFVDSSGSPIANEKVEGKSGEESFELTTDENGRIVSPARLDSYELTIRGESFTAHSLPVTDGQKEESVYRFVVGEAGPGDVHVLAAEMKSIGDTPLVHHPVRVLDPETGIEVAYAVTDAEGVVRVEVPENKAYRIEIVDEEEEHVAPPLHPDDEAAVLLCQFLDPAGNPIANERLEASAAGESFELQTDGNGRIESPARLDAYELRIRGVAFTAHALLARDREREGSLYRFVVPARGGESET